MSREYTKLKRDFRNLSLLTNMTSIAIKDLPKLIIEKYGVFFKKVYSEDMINLIHLFRKYIDFHKRIDSKENLEEHFMPSFDKKFNRLERELKKMHNKVSTLVFKYAVIQRAKKNSLESSFVLMVAYFEDFLKEVFKKQVNKTPVKSLPFLEKQIRVSDLKEHGFNLSQKMGSLIIQKINFQNLEEGAKTYKLAFGLDIFDKKPGLRKKALKLFQIRHLIVHNAGKINMAYLKIIRCDKNLLGKKVTLSLKDFKKYKATLLTIARYIEKKSQK